MQCSTSLPDQTPELVCIVCAYILVDMRPDTSSRARLQNNSVSGLITKAASMAPTSFFDLPAELHNFIYSEVLTANFGMQHNPIDLPCGSQAESVRRTLQLLCVNRQLREEAETIFWSENEFRVFITNKESQTIGDSIAQVGHRQASMIKQLTIHVNFRDITEHDRIVSSWATFQLPHQYTLLETQRELQSLKEPFERIEAQLRAAIERGVRNSAFRLEKLPNFTVALGTGKVVQCSVILAIHAKIREVVGTAMPVER